MRKLLALVGLIPVGILFACQDDSAAPPAPAVDGGNVRVDAANPSPDAAQQPDVDAGPLPVSVTVTHNGSPVPNVTVVFQDSTGAVIAPETTGATGTAAHLVPAGSQVTVVMGTTAAPRLLTITEVEPGDMLQAVDTDPFTTIPEVTVTDVPATPPQGNIVAHAGRCSGPSFTEPPGSIFMLSDCQVAGKFPLLLTVHEVEGFNEIAFAFKKDNAYAVDDAGAGPSINAAAGAWSTTFTSHTITVTNPVLPMNGQTVFGEVTGGLLYPGEVFYSPETTDPVSNVHKGHPGYPDFVQSEVQIRDSMNGGATLQALAVREAAPAGDATTTLDLATVLPKISSATFDGNTPNDRPAVNWTAIGVDGGAATLDAADGAYVVAEWSANDGQVVGTWTFVTPANRTAVKAPMLPASVADHAPPAADAAAVVWTAPPTVAVVDPSFTDGYRTLRQVSGAIPAGSAVRTWISRGSFAVPALPQAGSIRVSGYTVDIE